MKQPSLVLTVAIMMIAYAIGAIVTALILRAV